MKLNMSSFIVLVIALAASVLSGCTVPPSPAYAYLYGQPTPVEGADRQIVITPNTQHVNIEGGQTVAFLVGDKQFAWNFFSGQRHLSIPLDTIAPPGVLNHPVQVYVTPDWKYLGP